MPEATAEAEEVRGALLELVDSGPVRDVLPVCEARDKD